MAMQQTHPGRNISFTHLKNQHTVSRLANRLTLRTFWL